MTNLKKYIAILTLAAATPAFAGELTGTGDPTPVNDGVANSICSFSGLQDGDPPFFNTRVQSYGAIRASFGGRAPFHGGPGDSCNGS